MEYWQNLTNGSRFSKGMNCCISTANNLPRSLMVKVINYVQAGGGGGGVLTCSYVPPGHNELEDLTAQSYTFMASLFMLRFWA